MHHVEAGFSEDDCSAAGSVGQDLASSPDAHQPDFDLPGDTDGLQPGSCQAINLYDQSQDLLIPDPTALLLPPPHIYPDAEGSFEQVTASPGIFNEAYRRFAANMRISLDKLPKLASKELDLYLLFTEVCRHGGCEAVISKKLWRVMSRFSCL